MNLPILVSLDLLDVGTRCLVGGNKLTWYQLEITVAVAHRYSIIGIVGKMSLTHMIGESGQYKTSVRKKSCLSQSCRKTSG
jgi:hypothetical protein